MSPVGPTGRPVRRSEALRALSAVPGFPDPRPDLEQVVTPVPAALSLLELAVSLGDIVGQSVLDLGCGTGRLAVGAALFGARSVVGVDLDPQAVRLAREASAPWGPLISIRRGDVGTVTRRADVVIMNPPFGAQLRHADRPFWERAFRLARRRVYAFALAESRTFILKSAVEANAEVETTRPVPWELPRLFPHHRRDRVSLSVDLWAIRTEKRT